MCDCRFKNRKSQIANRKSSEGFTLLELIILLILVGLLAAVAVPKYLDLSQQSQINATQKKMQELKIAILGNPDAIAAGRYTRPGYWGDVGQLPSALADLITKPGGVSSFDKFTRRGWNGPYLDTQQTAGSYVALQDAWGTAFSYSTPSGVTGRRFIITSFGPDKASGGGDDITMDITF